MKKRGINSFSQSGCLNFCVASFATYVARVAAARGLGRVKGSWEETGMMKGGGSAYSETLAFHIIPPIA